MYYVDFKPFLFYEEPDRDDVYNVYNGNAGVYKDIQEATGWITYVTNRTVLHIGYDGGL